MACRRIIYCLSLVCALLGVAGALFAGVGRAYASEATIGGRVTASRRTTSSDTSPDSQQIGFTTTINSSGYIWRPWYATFGLQLDLSQISTEVEQDEFSGKQESSNELVSGEGRLNLFPRSRFPLEAFFAISDSRTESDTVGVPLEEIDTLRRERIGATQRYRPVTGHSNYAVQAVRTRVTKTDAGEEITDDVSVSGSHRRPTQSLSYNLKFRETKRDATPLATLNALGDPTFQLGGRAQEAFATLDGAESQERDTLGEASMSHVYRPTPTLTFENNLDATSDEERFDSSSSREEITSAATFMTWRPEDSKWTVRANMSVQESERRQNDVTFGETETSGDATNVSTGVTYEFTRHLRANMNVAANRTRSDDAPQVEQVSEDAGLEYTPAPIPLGEVFYDWSARGNISNSETTGEQSIQGGSVGLLHGLSRVLSNDSGRTVSLSINQGVTEFRNSEGAELVTLSHLGSVAAHWSGVKSTNRLQTTLVDTRVKGKESDAPEALEVDSATQTLNLLGTHRYMTSRSSSLEADLNYAETRVVDQSGETQYIFARVGVGFSTRHTFNVNRLSFRTRVEHGIQQSDFEAIDASEAEFGDFGNNEERSSWDSRFDYTIGLLSLSLRHTLTAIDGNRTRTNVVALSRVF